jgi:hypothetical protein
MDFRDEDQANLDGKNWEDRGLTEFTQSRAKGSRVGTVRMLMRLALGSVVIGREEMLRRFQEKQSETSVPASTLNEVTPIESESDRLRYAAIGAMSRSSDTLGQGISVFGRLTNRTFGFFTRAVSPLTESRMMGPFRRRYQRYVDQGERVVGEWVAVGRREEYLGRQLAQDTVIESIEETLDYLAESPEMDELTQQQSVDLIEDVFDDVGERTSRSGMILVDWFSGMALRRPRSKTDRSSKPEGDKG